LGRCSTRTRTRTRTFWLGSRVVDVVVDVVVVERKRDHKRSRGFAGMVRAGDGEGGGWPAACWRGTNPHDPETDGEMLRSLQIRNRLLICKP